MSHTIVYIQSLAICILLLVMLLIMNFRHGTPRYFGHLACIYGLNILSAVLDIIWILIDGEKQWTFLAYITHPIYLCCFALISAIWFSYCVKLLPFSVYKTKLQKVLTFIPIGVIVLLDISSVFTGWIFYLDESYRYCRGSLYMVQMVSYLYLIATCALALKAMQQAQLSSVRKLYGSLAVFGVFPVVLGVLSVIAPPGGLPTMQYSIALSLFLIFVENQSLKITNDSLTGLFNRYSLDYSISERINRFKKTGERFFILMGDLNGFKSINDTYGHMEGDRMLKLVADIMDTIAKDYGSQASRLGGDEFAIVVSCKSFATAVEMKNRICDELGIASRRENRDLSISIGIAEYKNDMTLIQFLDQADQNLYLEKNKL